VRFSVVVLTLLATGLTACGGCKKGPSLDDPDDASITETTSGDAGPVTVEAFDAGSGNNDEPKIAALEFTTPVFNVMEWPPKDPSKTSDARAEAVRLGYLRRGSIVTVKSKVTKKGNCPEGWYELTTGGFVCGKFVTTDLKSKDLETAPHPPFTDRPLPYDYGLNLTNGAPLYRRRPLKKERNGLEKGLAIGKTKRNDDGSIAKEPSARNGDPMPSPDGSATPWYLQDHHGERPQVKIDDIRTNEQGGLVVVRMVRGFYLALDQELSTQSGKFWRNTAGYLAPSDHILVHKATTEFEGVEVGKEGEKRHLPLGWVTSPKARHYFIEEEDERNGHARRGDPVDRFTIVQLTGKKKVVEDRNYYETEEGWYLRDIDGTMTRPGPPPKGIGEHEKWIDVNLSAQSLVAFEGDKPVYATIISSGRHNDEDKTKDHRTVQGEFRIREKHIAATMEDDGAVDGPYSIQDVPWIMYFEGSYALHGAFWHSKFGHEKSHGCVNMTPFDAKHVFAWAGPDLPTGWHGVKSTKENPGTRVIVHEDPKPTDGDKPASSASAPAEKAASKPSKDEKPSKDDKKDDKTKLAPAAPTPAPKKSEPQEDESDD
jgi:hypothetical protein